MTEPAVLASRLKQALQLTFCTRRITGRSWLLPATVEIGHVTGRSLVLHTPYRNATP